MSAGVAVRAARRDARAARAPRRRGALRRPRPAAATGSCSRPTRSACLPDADVAGAAVAPRCGAGSPGPGRRRPAVARAGVGLHGVDRVGDLDVHVAGARGRGEPRGAPQRPRPARRRPTTVAEIRPARTPVALTSPALRAEADRARADAVDADVAGVERRLGRAARPGSAPVRTRCRTMLPNHEHEERRYRVPPVTARRVAGRAQAARRARGRPATRLPAGPWVIVTPPDARVDVDRRARPA